MSEHEIRIDQIVVVGSGLSEGAARELAEAIRGSLIEAMSTHWSGEVGVGGRGVSDGVNVEWPVQASAAQVGRAAAMRIAASIRGGG